MAEYKPKRFRLSFVNAAEDVPRLIRAWGRACFGEFALVLRPSEQRGVLVRVTKEGAFLWTGAEGDAPVLPATGIAPGDAVARVKTEQKAVPKPGPITLRGQWSGYLHCDDGTPRVEVTRKLAAYGLLRISSSPTGWNWTVERTEKWFSTAGSDTGTAMSLSSAIGAGLARAMRLLGEACSTRDSHRRAALDAPYAADHPVRPAKEGRDPTERLQLREPRKSQAGAPSRMDAPVSLPDAPSTPSGVQRMADEIAREADALAALRDVSWVWHDSTARDDAIHWFRQSGFDELADALAAYDGDPDHPPERLVEQLYAGIAQADQDESAKQKASAVLASVEAAFHSAPYVLERARRLIRHAARLTETELCRGTERKEAANAIQRAIHAYDEARSAVSAGTTAEARTRMRSMVEWAALAAAKAARGCASGQTTLPTKPVQSKPVVPAVEAPPPSKRRRGRPTAPLVPKPEGETSPPRAPRAEKTPAEPPQRSKRPAPSPPPTPGAIQRSPRRKPTARNRSSSEVDAEKDKRLLDAFRDAISAAMTEVGPT